MTALRRVPPGRAGRLWLIDRLRSGRLAASLLDRKLAILRIEQQRLRLRADQTRERWQERWRQADVWAVRAALVGGERELRLSAPADPVEVTISWASVMGVRYPTATECLTPQAAPGDRGPGTAALVEAKVA